MKKGQFFAKRVMDIIFSFMLLMVFFPLCVLIMIASMIFLGRPIFFKQKRIGKGGGIFWIIKFRTFPIRKSENILCAPTEKELTRYGHFLRKYSLDELPSFWNVIKGDLALVGPRPLLPEFFFPEQRHVLRPGMTGLAQIKGRNIISWREKFRYDLWYVKHVNLSLDTYILYKTIHLIFSAKGSQLPSQEYFFPTVYDDCSKFNKPLNQTNK
jgi:lipopolysaccharide/colanic/teichoic acid biosynthesis glycosyltransferase